MFDDLFAKYKTQLEELEIKQQNQGDLKQPKVTFWQNRNITGLKQEALKQMRDAPQYLQTAHAHSAKGIAQIAAQVHAMLMLT